MWSRVDAAGLADLGPHLNPGCEVCSGPVAESSAEASGTEGVVLSNSSGVTSGSEGSRDC